MKSEFLTLVESTNENLVAEVFSKAVDNLVEHQSVNKFFEELQKMEEGPIQGLFDLINRHILPNTAKFIELLQKIFLAKGLPQEEVDVMLKDIKSRLEQNKKMTGNIINGTPKIDFIW